MVLNKNIKKIIKLTLGLILFVWLSYSLYHQIQAQKDLQSALDHLFTDWNTTKVFLLILVFVLMLANWSIESLKWQMLMKHTEPIKFLKAFQSVLTGLAVSIITPNRVGEYLGRILYLKNTNKLKGISITIIGSFAQILVTGFFGILGLIFFVTQVKSSTELYLLLIFSIVTSALMAFLLFNLSLLVRFCERYHFLRKIKIYIEVIKRYDNKLLWKLIAYAASRYIVYSLQFYLLLRITHGFFLPLSAFGGIWLNFWVIAVVPSFVIADIGVRGATAIKFLSFASTNFVALLSSSILLWFINLILPALIGCFFVYRIKVFEDE